MNAFEIAWNVLKANTIPIRPKVMQYATDQKKTMGLEQTGGVARSARRKLMDEFQAEKNHDHPDSFSEGETDIMNQQGDKNYRDAEEYEGAYQDEAMSYSYGNRQNALDEDKKRDAEKERLAYLEYRGLDPATHQMERLSFPYNFTSSEGGAKLERF